MLETFAIFQNESNQKLAETLSKAGKLILLPQPKPCKIAIQEIDIRSFHWLIFVDVISTEFFLEELKLRDFDFYELDYLQIGAAGEAIAERLRLEEIHCDIIAASNKLVDTISGYVQQVQGLQFLIIAGKYENQNLREALRKKDADVTEIQIYEFKIEEDKKLTMLKTLIKGGGIDKLILASPHEVVALKWLFKSDLHQALAETRIFAMNEITFLSLEEEGLNPEYWL
jgi:uroporphyrinogen-III synthase